MGRGTEEGGREGGKGQEGEREAGEREGGGEGQEGEREAGGREGGRGREREGGRRKRETDVKQTITPRVIPHYGQDSSVYCLTAGWPAKPCINFQ